MDISSRFVKVQSQFEIPNDLTIGKDYEIVLNGSVTARTERDGEDGTLEREYRFKAILGAITNEIGQSIPLKDQRSHSKRFRSMIMNVWGEDYDKVMNTLLANGDELKDWVTKRF